MLEMPGPGDFNEKGCSYGVETDKEICYECFQKQNWSGTLEPR